MASDASRSKDDRIRCREDNPSRDVPGPERGEHTALQYLFPSEFLQLIRCEDVPLAWRWVIAVAAYLYARTGELRALTWDDVDLEHRLVSITKAIESRSGKLKTTKNRYPRRVPIEPELYPLLVAMHRESGGKGAMVKFPAKQKHQAESFRSWLNKAGITRASLFERSPSVVPIRMHDMRATGCTWAAVRGDRRQLFLPFVRIIVADHGAIRRCRSSTAPATRPSR